MLTPDQRQVLNAFLEQHPTAVIATADLDHAPAAAVVLFAADEDGSLIFGTHPTRKYRNLKANPKAAMVITKEYTSVQFHGQAVELTGSAVESATALFRAKHPEADKHMMAGSVFFRFTPNWVRYMDTSVKPPVQFESDF